MNLADIGEVVVALVVYNVAAVIIRRGIGGLVGRSLLRAHRSRVHLGDVDKAARAARWAGGGA